MSSHVFLENFFLMRFDIFFCPHSILCPFPISHSLPLSHFFQLGMHFILLLFFLSFFLSFIYFFVYFFSLSSLWEQVLRSTGHSSTIQIEEKLFDTFKSCDLRLGFSSTWEQQLSKKELVEEKKKTIDFD